MEQLLRNIDSNIDKKKPTSMDLIPPKLTTLFAKVLTTPEANASNVTVSTKECFSIILKQH